MMANFMVYYNKNTNICILVISPRRWPQQETQHVGEKNVNKIQRNAFCLLFTHYGAYSLLKFRVLIVLTEFKSFHF
jgi:hypothetical protein